MGGFGVTELVIVFIIVLVLFGHKRVPQLMSGIGESISGFKKAMLEAEEVDLDLPTKKSDRE